MQPIPKPKPKDSEDEFIHRCMSDSGMMQDFPRNDQRLAVCFRRWKKGLTEEGLTPSQLQMHRFQLSFPLAGAIDRASHTICGVSVITEGAAKGHKLQIDSRTLEQVRDGMSQFSGGLKVKIDHGSGAGSIVGALRNGRIDGKQLRADLHLLKSSPHKEWVMEMAETMPDSFGMSISFSGVNEEAGDIRLARCHEIYSCDIVDQPAANPTGLFSAVIDTTKPTNDMTIETPEFVELKAAHAASVERFQKLDTDFQAVSAERTELTAKLSEAQTKITSLETANTELKASAEKAATEHAAALADFNKKVELAAAEKLAATGTSPVKLGADKSETPKELAAKLDAITDPIEKIRFYRTNKDAIDASFRL